MKWGRSRACLRRRRAALRDRRSRMSQSDAWSAGCSVPFATFSGVTAAFLAPRRLLPFQWGRAATPDAVAFPSIIGRTGMSS